MSAHIQNDRDSQCTVEYDACNAIGIEKCLFCVMASQAVDDVQNHRHQNNSHAHGNRYDKHGI